MIDESNVGFQTFRIDSLLSDCEENEEIYIPSKIPKFFEIYTKLNEIQGNMRPYLLNRNTFSNDQEYPTEFHIKKRKRTHGINTIDDKEIREEQAVLCTNGGELKKEDEFEYVEVEDDEFDHIEVEEDTPIEKDEIDNVEKRRKRGHGQIIENDKLPNITHQSHFEGQTTVSQSKESQQYGLRSTPLTGINTNSQVHCESKLFEKKQYGIPSTPLKKRRKRDHGQIIENDKLPNTTHQSHLEGLATVSQSTESQQPRSMPLLSKKKRDHIHQQEEIHKKITHMLHNTTNSQEGKIYGTHSTPLTSINRNSLSIFTDSKKPKQSSSRSSLLPNSQTHSHGNTQRDSLKEKSSSSQPPSTVSPPPICLSAKKKNQSKNSQKVVILSKIQTLRGEVDLLPLCIQSLYAIFCALENVCSLQTRRGKYHIFFDEIRESLVSISWKRVDEIHLFKISYIFPEAFCFEYHYPPNSGEIRILIRPWQIFADTPLEQYNKSIINERKLQFLRNLLDSCKSLDPPTLDSIPLKYPVINQNQLDEHLNTSWEKQEKKKKFSLLSSGTEIIKDSGSSPLYQSLEEQVSFLEELRKKSEDNMQNHKNLLLNKLVPQFAFILYSIYKTEKVTKLPVNRLIKRLLSNCTARLSQEEILERLQVLVDRCPTIYKFIDVDGEKMFCFNTRNPHEYKMAIEMIQNNNRNSYNL